MEAQHFDLSDECLRKMRHVDLELVEMFEMVADFPEKRGAFLWYICPQICEHVAMITLVTPM